MTLTEKGKAQLELTILSETQPLTLQQGADELGINNRSRKYDVLFKRQLFWMMVKSRFDKTVTLKELGKVTGGQVHGSVINGIRNCDYQSPKMEAYRQEVFEVVSRIKIY